MEKQQLQRTLSELHEALGSVDELDGETRRMILTLTQDLERLLQEKQVTPEDVRPVSSDLQATLLQFEAEHPQITGILNRIASMLANLGI